MTQILADCPTHGSFVVENLIELTGPAEVNFEGVTVQCPMCGKRANVVDGNYTRDSLGFETANLTPSPAQMMRLRSALTWGQNALADGTLSPQVVERKVRRTVEKEAPQLAALADKALSDRLLGPKSATFAAWAALILALLTYFATINQEPSQEQVLEIIKQVEDLHHSEESSSNKTREEPLKMPKGKEEPPRPEEVPEGTEGLTRGRPLP